MQAEGGKARHFRAALDPETKSCYADSQRSDGQGFIVSDDQLILAVADRLSEIPLVAARVEKFCAAAGIPPSLGYTINLALEELLTNTISYGFDSKSGPSHAIEVRIRREGEEVVIEMSDNGRPFDPLQAPAPDLDASIEDRLVGGLGVYLVKTMMDDMQYSYKDGRNRVTLKKRIPRESGPKTSD